MFKTPFYLLVLLFSSHVYSASTLAKEDGKILIVLKNNYPCFYLADNEPIYHIGLASRGLDDYKYNYSYKIGEEKFGFSKSTCITVNHHTKFPYNTPFSVYVGGYNNAYTQNSPNDIQGNRSSSHLYSTTNFCILKSQTEKARLVKARKSHFWETGGQFKCTNQDWTPK